MKNLKSEIRKAIATVLIGWIFNLLSDESKFKQQLANIVLENFHEL